MDRAPTAILRRLLVSVSTILGCISTFGQSQAPHLYPIPVRDKWGYVEGRGAAQIPARFEYASAFQEGLAVVQLDGKHGFINFDGSAVLQPSLKDASPFSAGLAAARPNAVATSTTRASSQSSTVPHSNHPSRRKSIFRGAGCRYFPHGKSGYINRAGELVIEAKFTMTCPFTLGLVVSAQWAGYIDTNGHFVWKPALASLGDGQVEHCPDY